MKQDESTHAIATSTMLFLALFSATLLIAPHLLQPLGIETWPTWQIYSLGGLMFCASLLSLSSIVLEYPPRSHTFIQLTAITLLTTVGSLYSRSGWMVESFWVYGTALALLLSLRFNQVDWLATCGWVLGILVGLACLTRPDWVELGMGNSRETLALIFLISGMIGIVHRLKPGITHTASLRFLAVPWLTWFLLSALAVNVPQMLTAAAASISLFWLRMIPWKQVVLREARAVGRRFFDIILTGQVLGMGLILTLLFTADYFVTSDPIALHRLRDVALLIYCFLGFVSAMLILSINLSINGVFWGLSQEAETIPMQDSTFGILSFLRNSFLVPFTMSRDLVEQRDRQKREYENLLLQSAQVERRRMAQLNLLHQLNLELENELDPPVSAQLVANAVCAGMEAGLCAVMENDPERNEVRLVASSGPFSHLIPPEYRQDNRNGIIGRAGRLRRTQLISDTRLDPDIIPLEGVEMRSALVIPMLDYNQFKGIITLSHPQPNAFDDSDIRTLEAISLRLLSSWQRSDHDQRLMRLIQAGVNLSTTLDLEGVMRQIADIALQTLDAHFVFVALLDKGGGFTRIAHTGYAPTLLSMLSSDPEGNTLIQVAINQPGPMRLRDVRKRFQSAPTGSSHLRPMIGVPIRMRQSSIGVILAFGKRKSRAFNENDESLASLLAGQASAAIETTWLYQELRSMLSTATQLYQLSTQVIQAEQLTDAAAAIAATTYQISQARAAGIVLQVPAHNLDIRVQIDENGLHPGQNHPLDLIRQAIETGQNIMMSGPNEMMRVCIPLQTPRHRYGALWVEVAEKTWGNARFSSNLHTLSNQASIALERSILLAETLRQAEQLELAYHKLEATYDQTLGALSSALDARDRETEGHSMRVARLASELGRQMGMDDTQSKIMERGAILHDIGKIGISDSILLKPGPLSPDEWHIMRQHPDIGARIIEGIPFLQEAMPVIRYHQERWDGSGYPIGLKGTDIPLMARIFAVVDAYDALTTDRPYRKKMPIEDALQYLGEQSGIHFDPEVVIPFQRMIREQTAKENP